MILAACLIPSWMPLWFAQEQDTSQTRSQSLLAHMYHASALLYAMLLYCSTVSSFLQDSLHNRSSSASPGCASLMRSLFVAKVKVLEPRFLPQTLRVMTVMSMFLQLAYFLRPSGLTAVGGRGTSLGSEASMMAWANFTASCPCSVCFCLGCQPCIVGPVSHT